jgi:hypothetical protein
MRTDFGVLPEGRRNDGLMRYGAALRRRGKTQPEIAAELLKANLRRCRPPLSPDEVEKIAASVSRYPVGGADPLQQAWGAVKDEPHASGYELFVLLVHQLHSSRPGHPVALPLERIAELMDYDWSRIRQFRKQAIASGLLSLADCYIPHRRAATYLVTPSGSGITTSLRTLRSFGLAGISAASTDCIPSGNSSHEEWKQVVRLAMRGLRLFPCVPSGKVPLLKSWPEVATCKLVTLERWFQEYPSCNWACACGAGSGIWVLDVDSDAAGAAMMRLFQKHGYIGPETLCTVTGRGFGYHLWFRYPEGANIKNRTGIGGWHDGLDVRGDGGYVMVPPSIWSDCTKKAKAEGREPRSPRSYHFLQGDDRAIATAPEWLMEIVTAGAVPLAAETCPFVLHMHASPSNASIGFPPAVHQ